MSNEHAHDIPEPAEGSYTDGEYPEGTSVHNRVVDHTDHEEGAYTDGDYSEGPGVHERVGGHLDHEEGEYTDAEHAHKSGGTGIPEEAEGEYTDGAYPDDDTDAGRAGAPRP